MRLVELFKENILTGVFGAADRSAFDVKLLDTFARASYLELDYEHEAAKAYGVAYESFLPDKNLTMGGVPKRSAFVIDGEGIVRYAEVNDNPGDLPNFDAIKETLQGL